MTDEETGSPDRQTISAEALEERTKRARALLEQYSREQPIKPLPLDNVAPCPEEDSADEGPSAEDMVYDIYTWRKGREPLRISISNASWEILFKVAEGEDLATFVGHLVDYIVLDARTLLGRERMESARTHSPANPTPET